MARSGTIFVSDPNGNAVSEFSLSGKHQLLGVLSGSFSGPTGMAVDGQGTLYVANAGGEIVEYAKEGTQPSTVLNDPGYWANAVAVGSDGTVYVANLFKDEQGSGQGAGNVVAFAPGSTSPTETFNDSHFFYVTGVAVDGQNDLFVSYDEGTSKNPTRTGRVVEFVKGSSNPTEIISVPGPRKNSGTYALALDKTGDVVVAAYGAGAFYVYDPGNPKPIRSFGSGPAIVNGMAFDATGSSLFSSELGTNALDIFDYADGKMSGTIRLKFSDGYGVAVDPPLAE